LSFAELFQREEIVELGNLRVQPFERLVLPGDFLRQEELHHQKHREQEDDGENQWTAHRQSPASN
jgi:hypothetical protein